MGHPALPPLPAGPPVPSGNEAEEFQVLVLFPLALGGAQLRAVRPKDLSGLKPAAAGGGSSSSVFRALRKKEP